MCWVCKKVISYVSLICPRLFLVYYNILICLRPSLSSMAFCPGLRGQRVAVALQNLFTWQQRGPAWPPCWGPALLPCWGLGQALWHWCPLRWHQLPSTACRAWVSKCRAWGTAEAPPVHHARMWVLPYGKEHWSPWGLRPPQPRVGRSTEIPKPGTMPTFCTLMIGGQGLIAGFFFVFFFPQCFLPF